MKRGTWVFAIAIIFLLIFSISFASAFSFGDLWKKLTGRAISCMGASGTDPYDDCGACKVCDNGVCVNIVSGTPDKDNVYGCGATTGKVCDGIGNCGSVAYTYSWYSGNWNSCSASCGTGTQTRSVYCKRNDGTQVADNYCSGTKNSSSQSCNTQACTCVSPNSCKSSCMPSENQLTTKTCASGICCGVTSTTTTTQVSSCNGNTCTVYSGDSVSVGNYSLKATVRRDTDVGANTTTFNSLVGNYDIGCNELRLGEKCQIGNLVLTIQKVSVSYTPVLDKHVTFSFIDYGNTITPAGKITTTNTCVSPNSCKSSCMPSENQLTQYTCASGICCGALNNVCAYSCYTGGAQCPEGQVIKAGTCTSGICCGNKEQTLCQGLINRIKNPQGLISNNGLTFEVVWNDEQRETAYINRQEELTTKYSIWGYYYDESETEGNQYLSLSYQVYVFDNKNINLEEWLGSYLDNDICKLDYYYSHDEENRIYICNWDDYYTFEPSTNNNEERQILWFNKNVLVEIDTYKGREISNEESTKIAQEEITTFLNDLKDNQGTWTYNENFNIDNSFESQIVDSLSECPSKISLDTCSPCWQCKTEPVICPSHGYQTKTCVDYCCDTEKKIYQSDCTPGICEGCLVPKWIGVFDSNKCIPYGFRFAKETGGYNQKLEDIQQEQRLYEPGEEGEISLQILSDTEAKLTIYDENGVYGEYSLVEGQEAEITIPNWDNEINKFVLVITDVHYSSAGSKDNYVDMVIKGTTLVDVPITINAYCDIDGEVKEQRTKSTEGGWANCQNNYECESNICSSGECIEVTDMLQKTKGIKSMVIRIICRLGNLLNNDNYASCIADNLGSSATSPPSSGGAGGSGSN